MIRYRQHTRAGLLNRGMLEYREAYTPSMSIRRGVEEIRYFYRQLQQVKPIVS